MTKLNETTQFIAEILSDRKTHFIASMKSQQDLSEKSDERKKERLLLYGRVRQVQDELEKLRQNPDHLFPESDQALQIEKLNREWEILDGLQDHNGKMADFWAESAQSYKSIMDMYENLNKQTEKVANLLLCCDASSAPL